MNLFSIFQYVEYFLCIYFCVPHGGDSNRSKKKHNFWRKREKLSQVKAIDIILRVCMCVLTTGVSRWNSKFHIVNYNSHKSIDEGEKRENLKFYLHEITHLSLLWYPGHVFLTLPFPSFKHRIYFFIYIINTQRRKCKSNCHHLQKLFINSFVHAMEKYVYVWIFSCVPARGLLFSLSCAVTYVSFYSYCK